VIGIVALSVVPSYLELFRHRRGRRSPDDDLPQVTSGTV
jgi:hypothetical protein